MVLPASTSRPTWRPLSLSKANREKSEVDVGSIEGRERDRKNLGLRTRKEKRTGSDRGASRDLFLWASVFWDFF